MEADYYAEAPGALLASCQAPTLEEVEPARWADSVSIDCSNEEMLHGDAGNGVFRSFDPASTPGVPEGPVRVIAAQGAGEVLDLAAGRHELILVGADVTTVSVDVSLVEAAR